VNGSVALVRIIWCAHEWQVWATTAEGRLVLHTECRHCHVATEGAVPLGGRVGVRLRPGEPPRQEEPDA
jgi:hypothetical protein